MPVDVNGVVESAAGRSDAVYLAVIVIVFCGLLIGGLSYISLRLWKELRAEIRREQTSLKFALESISVTNLSVQQMLSTIHLTKITVVPETPEACQEYMKQTEELKVIQDRQRERLEAMFLRSQSRAGIA